MQNIVIDIIHNLKSMCILNMHNLIDTKCYYLDNEKRKSKEFQLLRNYPKCWIGIYLNHDLTGEFDIS